MPDYDSLLHQWVVEESKVVTYRYLSRHQDLHVSEAKRLLQKFYDSNRSKVHATFALIGTLTPPSPPALTSDSMDVDQEAPKQNDGGGEQEADSNEAAPDAPSSPVELQAVLLVSEAKLQDALSKFVHPPRQHVYSLSAAAAKGHPVYSATPSETPFQQVSIPLLYGVNKSLLSDPELAEKWEQAGRGVKWGTIQNDTVVQLKTSVWNRPSGDGHKLKDSSSSAARKENASKAAQPTSSKSKSDPVKKERSFFGQTSQDKDKKKEGQTSTSKGTKRKGGEDEAEVVAVSDDDEVVVKPKTKAKSKEEREKQRKELEDMMDVDSDDEAEEAALRAAEDAMQSNEESQEAASKPKAKGRTSEAKSKAATTSKVATDKPAATKEPKADRKRVRKTRTVTKKEKYKNEKGYNVTRNVEEYESYSSWESDSDTDARAKPVKAPTAKASASTSKSASPASAPKVESKPAAATSSATGQSAGSKKLPPPAKKDAPPAKGKNQASLSSFFSKVDKKKK